MRFLPTTRLAVLCALAAASHLVAEDSPGDDSVQIAQESKQWVEIQGKDVTHLESLADFQKRQADVSASDRTKTKLLLAASKLTDDVSNGRRLVEGSDCDFVIITAQKTIKGKADQFALDITKGILQITDGSLQTSIVADGHPSEKISQVIAKRITLNLDTWALRIEDSRQIEGIR